MIRYRLEVAREYLDDAKELFNENRFNSAASRAYYASYQAMWAALGELRDGKIWRHLSQFQNVPVCPISASDSNFNPRNTQCIPVVKIFTFLDLEQTETF